MSDLAWINGEITDLHSAKISYLDHGYYFGYGVYEAIKLYGGKAFALEEHLDRLDYSLAAIKIVPDFTRAQLKGFILELIKKSDLKEAMLYLQITRGTGPRTHSAIKDPKPPLTMFISYLPPMPSILRESGAKAIILPDDRWAHPSIKTINLLPNILAKQTADEQGAYEAIFVRENGLITECASSNVFAVFGDTLYTPPMDGRILGGISRLSVLKIAQKNNLKYVEESFTPDRIKKADEVFVTNTSAEVLPITKIDETVIGNGKPGLMTQRIYELFQKEIEVNLSVD